MTEQKPQRKGRDFAIGFFGSLLLALIALVLTIPAKSPAPLFIAAIGAVIATVITFRRHHKFIGIGILAALVGVPLLMLGSCFAYASLY